MLSLLFLNKSPSRHRALVIMFAFAAAAAGVPSHVGAIVGRWFRHCVLSASAQPARTKQSCLEPKTDGRIDVTPPSPPPPPRVRLTSVVVFCWAGGRVDRWLTEGLNDGLHQTPEGHKAGMTEGRKDGRTEGRKERGKE